MFTLKEIPNPPDSHYVGIVFQFENEGSPSVFAVKDNDKFREIINFKLPGGSDDQIYREYMDYENLLFKNLEKLGFNKKGQTTVYRNERKRKKLLEAYGDDSTVIFVLRTFVMSCLEKLGYYPMDLEPKVVHLIEKDGHTQYFLEATTLINKEGEEVKAVVPEDNFRAIALDIIETRIPLPLEDFSQLIHSHRQAVEKLNLLRKPAAPTTPVEPSEED